MKKSVCESLACTWNSRTSEGPRLSGQFCATVLVVAAGGVGCRDTGSGVSEEFVWGVMGARDCGVTGGSDCGVRGVHAAEAVGGVT